LAQLLDTLGELKWISTQLKAHRNMIGADSMHELIEVAVSNKDIFRTSAVQIPALVNKCEKSRIHEEFLVSIGLGGGGPTKVWSLGTVQFAVAQHSYISDRWRHAEDGRYQYFRLSHELTCSLIFVSLIVSAHFKSCKVRNGSGGRPSFYGALTGS
jgi:hypothetical protein